MSSYYPRNKLPRSVERALPFNMECSWWWRMGIHMAVMVATLLTKECSRPLPAAAGRGTSPTFHLSDSSCPTNAMPLSAAEVSIADKTGPRIKSTHPQRANLNLCFLDCLVSSPHQDSRQWVMQCASGVAGNEGPWIGSYVRRYWALRHGVWAQTLPAPGGFCPRIFWERLRLVRTTDILLCMESDISLQSTLL